MHITFAYLTESAFFTPPPPFHERILKMGPVEPSGSNVLHNITVRTFINALSLSLPFEGQHKVERNFIS
jgi:hypothetical protein